MKKDVSKFYKSCNNCQVIGKPNQKKTHAPNLVMNICSLLCVLLQDFPELFL